MNKFYILNMMQKSVVDCKDFDRDGQGMPCWELKATYTYEGVTRSRTVTFIVKNAQGYHTVGDLKTYKTFMAALASLMDHFVYVMKSLVKSMAFDSYDNVIDSVFQPIPEFTVPALPTYDRGPKKQVLHPLRRHVTKHYEGRYSR